jgi:hypothetical protein
MHCTEGVKNEATSNLHGTPWSFEPVSLYEERAYPANFICPIRTPHSLSLSRVLPNLMYCGSCGFLNRSFVVLSKQETMWSRSSRKTELERRSERGR